MATIKWNPAGLIPSAPEDTTFQIDTFCHPLVSDLVTRLNDATGDPIAALCDPTYLASLETKYSTFLADDAYVVSALAQPPRKRIELDLGKPCAVYNWELLHYLPVALAVYQTSKGYFPEAMKTFHLVFDPTTTDTSVPAPQRYWRFLGFRSDLGPTSITNAYDLLLRPDSQLSADDRKTKQRLLQGFLACESRPFEPYLAARSHPVSFQYYVAMKYMDNHIAWADHLFGTPTIERLGEATPHYVQVGNLLGRRPEKIPPLGRVAAKSYKQLKNEGLNTVIGNAFVDLEGQLPFDLSDTAPSTQSGGGHALFGTRKTPYFCIPPNAKLLSYWDIVDDRLTKIRNCQNLQGKVQMLPLFDPKIDPALLVKAVAAGLDIDTVVTGINQPSGPVRKDVLFQKALDMAIELRNMGNELQAAIDKGDNEHLTAMRQYYDTTIAAQTREVRFLQWQHAQKSTNALIASRQTAVTRYNNAVRALGKPPWTDLSPDRDSQTTLDATAEITADNFDAFLSAQTGKGIYTKGPDPEPFSSTDPSSSAQQSGASGAGNLYLNNAEQDQNDRIGDIRGQHLAAAVIRTAAAELHLLPDMQAKLAFWGIGAGTALPTGKKVGLSTEAIAAGLEGSANSVQMGSSRSALMATWQRRADDWVKEARYTAKEISGLGYQIVASLIAEQASAREYRVAATQADNSAEMLAYLDNDSFTTDASKAVAEALQATKFSNEECCRWQESQLTDLYQRTYRFALDLARRCEQLMKRELMRPELDNITYIQPNYWDAGRRGLLAGHALVQDLKRMELDCLDHNTRELELTRTISLRQLAPMSLLALRTTGSCTVDIPEWFFDRDCPGHYLRRIKNVAVSVPALDRQDGALNLTLTLQKSSVRVSPTLKNGRYDRLKDQDDDRFVDYLGTAESIVTSTGLNDTGMFETNLRDERYLPFEGAGLISTWLITLPPIPNRDYRAITDVNLTYRYTARDSGPTLAQKATASVRNTLKTAMGADQGMPPLLLSLRHDFPDAWWTFRTAADDAALKAKLELNHFPYLVFNTTALVIEKLTLYTAQDGRVIDKALPAPASGVGNKLKNDGAVVISLDKDDQVLTRTTDEDVYLLVTYKVTIPKSPGEN